MRDNLKRLRDDMDDELDAVHLAARVRDARERWEKKRQ